MGYQETMINIKFQDFKKLKQDIENNNLMFFVNLIGYYKNPLEELKPETEIFVIVTGERHPLADYLIKNYDAKPIEEVTARLMKLLWNNFEFIEDIELEYPI